MDSNNIVIKSLTGNKTYDFDNAVESLLASLTLCQLSTMKDLTRRGDFKINSAKFTKVESKYDIANYIKGGKDNKMSDIYIEAEIQTNGTQKQLD